MSYADTSVPETSAAAAKVLAALEYADAIITRRNTEAKPTIATNKFWERVQLLHRKICNTIGSKDGSSKSGSVAKS